MLFFILNLWGIKILNKLYTSVNLKYSFCKFNSSGIYVIKETEDAGG